LDRKLDAMVCHGATRLSSTCMICEANLLKQATLHASVEPAAQTCWPLCRSFIYIVLGGCTQQLQSVTNDDQTAVAEKAPTSSQGLQP
jgi:hypothetical protein